MNLSDRNDSQQDGSVTAQGASPYMKHLLEPGGIKLHVLFVACYFAATVWQGIVDQVMWGVAHHLLGLVLPGVLAATVMFDRVMRELLD